jgi:hypothetical protein
MQYKHDFDHSIYEYMIFHEIMNKFSSCNWIIIHIYLINIISQQQIVFIYSFFYPIILHMNDYYVNILPMYSKLYIYLDLYD